MGIKRPIYQDTAGTPARSTLGPEITQKHKQNRARTPRSQKCFIFTQKVGPIYRTAAGTPARSTLGPEKNRARTPRSRKCFIFPQKERPIYQDTAGTAARSTLGPEITKKNKQNRAPHTEGTFSIAKPEPTGNPSKNPKRHYKKPPPPLRLGWAGLGWAGLAGLGWLGDG